MKILKIKPIALGAISGNYLEANVTYKGEDEEISIYFEDESVYQNIPLSQKLKVAGEFQRSAYISINNARIVG